MSRDCAVCSKNVGFAEERKACNKIYHQDCFKCGKNIPTFVISPFMLISTGGTKTDGCGTKLALNSYTAHDQEPYCNPCYGKLFAPAGNFHYR